MEDASNRLATEGSFLFGPTLLEPGAWKTKITESDRDMWITLIKVLDLE